MHTQGILVRGLRRIGRNNACANPVNRLDLTGTRKQRSLPRTTPQADLAVIDPAPACRWVPIVTVTGGR